MRRNTRGTVPGRVSILGEPLLEICVSGEHVEAQHADATWKHASYLPRELLYPVTIEYAAFATSIFRWSAYALERKDLGSDPAPGTFWSQATQSVVKRERNLYTGAQSIRPVRTNE